VTQIQELLTDAGVRMNSFMAAGRNALSQAVAQSADLEMGGFGVRMARKTRKR
jgi:hypothetical protein